MLKRPRLLMFGGTGQVGSEISRGAFDKNIDLVTINKTQLNFLSVAESEILTVLDTERPDAVINCAAYTLVDKAETEINAAFSINADAPGQIARASALRNIPLVHFSTDYVFDGTATTAYTETQPIAPLSVYGQSKAAGEAVIQQAGGQSVILRTSWVFSGYGGNFVKTMLRLGRERDELRIVNDQTGCPTPAASLADYAITLAIDLAAGRQFPPILHACGEKPTTWYEFAGAIFTEAARYGHPVPRLLPIQTSDYPTAAIRPKWSVLDCRLAQAQGFDPIDWQAGLHAVLESLA